MTRKNSFFLIGMTSVLLAFAMIGCDNGTTTETKTVYVPTGGGSGGGGNKTAAEQVVLELYTGTGDVNITTPVTLTEPLTIKNRTITVGSGIAPNIANLSVGGEGPLFDLDNATASGSGTLNIKGQLTLGDKAKLIVASGSKVNIQSPTGGASTGLKVSGGAVLDVRGPSGVDIDAGAKLHFAPAAILAVPNVPGVIVVETAGVGETTGGIAIEAGLKLVIPGATSETKVFSENVSTAIFTIPENSGALAIDSTGLEVYTNSEATADKVVKKDPDLKPDTGDSSVGKTITNEAAGITDPFVRPAGTATYIIESLDGSLASLKAVTAAGNTETIGKAKSYTVPADVQSILNAVYTPNAPDTSDSFVPLEAGQGKSTVAYTAEVSAEVLKLFYITIAKDAKDDLIEVKGTLPKEILDATSATDILVIDIGLPEGNTGLPTFRIPTKALGDGSTPYGGVRLRVNKGAYLHIEADNSAYIGTPGGTTSGAGNSSGAGNFNNGCVEVMAGGKLRDGAFEGFPLGANATILNRLGSYLAVGPEPTHADATGSASAGYMSYYAGWLIGPKSDLTGTEATRIQWDDQNDGYIQVGDGQLVLGAKVTLTKLQGLIYDVWFEDTGAIKAGLTIDKNGALVQNGTQYKLYGQANHEIVLKETGYIMAAFLESGTGGTVPGGTYAATAVNGGSLVIKNTGADGGSTAVTANKFTGISGYISWTQPTVQVVAAVVGQLPVGKLASLN